MKKSIVVFLAGLIFIMPLSSKISVSANYADTDVVQTNESNLTRISFIKVYDSFEEMIEAGERYFYEDDKYSGYLSFESAYRIADTKKFIVTYVSSND